MPSVLTGRKVAAAQVNLLQFDQIPSVRRMQLGRMKKWGYRCIRDNRWDVGSELKSTAQDVADSSAARVAHFGDTVEDMSSLGLYFMGTLFDRAIGLDRDAGVRAALLACGIPMAGSGSLYEALGYGTGDAYGVDRSNARRFLIDCLLCVPGCTLSLNGEFQPGGELHDEDLFKALQDAIFTYLMDWLDDWKAAVQFGQGTLVVPQLLNGPEWGGELNVDPVWPHGSGGYFGNTARCLKSTAGTALLNSLFLGITIGHVFATAALWDEFCFDSVDWFARQVSFRLYGDTDPDNVLLVYSAHWYQQGKWQPRFVGDPRCRILTEFGMSRRYTELRNLGVTADRDSTGEMADDDYDADYAVYICVPRNTAWVLGYGSNSVAVTANASSETIQAAFDALAGIVPRVAGVQQDMTVERQWNNVSPIHTLLENESPVPMDGYHVRFGKAVDSATNSKSKLKHFARVWSSTAGVEVHSYMRGGEVDRGAALRKFAKYLLNHFDFLTYHTLGDPRGSTLWEAGDGSTEILWASGSDVGSYEFWRQGNIEGQPHRTRSLHDAGPFLSDEPEHYKFMAGGFAQLVNEAA